MAKTMTPSGMNQITSGQIGKLCDLLSARLRKSGLQSEPTQRVLASQGDALADEMVEVLRKWVEAGMLLAPRGEVDVTLSEDHDPETYYHNRSGLYVWDEFRTRVVAKAKGTSTGATFRVTSAELMRDMTDKEIEAGLPIEHFFAETSVCALIAGLIARQANGEDGVLKNDGRANLFYLSSFVVRVSWDADGRFWFVRAWHRGVYRWDRGSQVFSPATKS